MKMVGSSQKLSIAQTLPADILVELYEAAARSDPPFKKYSYPTSPYALSLPRSDRAKELLGPAWSQMPPAGASHKDRGGSTFHPSHGRSGLQASLGWILLTHVCSRWRAIGLSLSLLWGDIFSIFPELEVANTLLSRARGAPLTFDMEALSNTMPSSQSQRISVFQRFVKQHLASAGTITFPRHHESDWNISLLYRDEFPLLKDLHAELSYRPIMHPTFLFPKPFAPSLKHLVLTAFIPFTAPNLTNLELSLDEHTSEEDLRAFLSSSPLLEEFLLKRRWGMGRTADGTSPSLRKHQVGNLHLPILSVASFTMSRAIMFSQSLDIPSHATLGFVTYSVFDMPSLMDTIGPRLSDSRADCFSFSSNRDVDVFAASVYEPETKPSPRIFIRICQPEPSLEDKLALFHQLITRVNSNRIVSLHVNPYPYMSMGPLEDMVMTVSNGLRALSALTSLSMACVPMAHEWPFLEALRGSSNPDSPRFAPGLQTLIIYSDDTLLDKDLTKTEVECVQHRWDKLLSVLEHRQRIGIPLRRLMLEGARGDDPEVASINASGFARAAVLVDKVIDNRKDHALTIVES